MKPRSLSDNFKDGDLLYGLKIERGLYITELRTKKAVSKAPLTVDELNNKTLTSGKPKGKWSEETHKAAIDYLEETKLSQLDKSNLGFYTDHLQIMKETQHTKLSLKRNDYPDNPKKLSPSVRSKIRACKLAMLEYPKQKNMTIHFILDNINLQHVVDREFSIIESKSISKTSTPRAADVLHDAYTNAELRFVFKHFDEILAKNKGVIFYKDNQEINLLSWINQQPQAAKDAFIRYAQAKKLADLLNALEQNAVAFPSAQTPGDTTAESKTYSTQGLFSSPKEDPQPEDSSMAPQDLTLAADSPAVNADQQEQTPTIKPTRSESG